MNIKLVKFSNGKYGIRRGWFFHEYLSIEYSKYQKDRTDLIWWGKKSDFFAKNCMVDYEDAVEMFNALPMRFLNKEMNDRVKDKVIE